MAEDIEGLDPRPAGGLSVPPEQYGKGLMIAFAILMAFLSLGLLIGYFIGTAGEQHSENKIWGPKNLTLGNQTYSCQCIHYTCEEAGK